MKPRVGGLRSNSTTLGLKISQSAIAAETQLVGPTSDGMKTRDAVSIIAEIVAVGGAAYVSTGTILMKD